VWEAGVLNHGDSGLSIVFDPREAYSPNLVEGVFSEVRRLRRRESKYDHLKDRPVLSPIV
jgi:hypothetical protein